MLPKYGTGGPVRGASQDGVRYALDNNKMVMLAGTDAYLSTLTIISDGSLFPSISIKDMVYSSDPAIQAFTKFYENNNPVRYNDNSNISGPPVIKKYYDIKHVSD